MNRAAESGTPFKSLYALEQIIEMAKTAGFNNVSVTMGNLIYDLYFSHRSDHLNPGNAEAFLVAEK